MLHLWEILGKSKYYFYKISTRTKESVCTYVHKNIKKYIIVKSMCALLHVEFKVIDNLDLKDG